jgi:hypothetical protein
MESNEEDRLSDPELDDLLNAWEIAGPPAGLRASVFPMQMGLHRFRRAAWMAAAAACLLAAFGMGVLWNRTKTSTTPKPGSEQIVAGEAGSGDQPFEPIPYTIPLGRDEKAIMVRMDVSAAELLAAGFRLPASDAGEWAPADVIVGQDGRALAIRLITAGTNKN